MDLVCAARVFFQQTEADTDQKDKGRGGSSAIYGPGVVQLTENMKECTEYILCADLDMDDILKAKYSLQVCGHYGRPDLLWLGVDPAANDHVPSQQLVSRVFSSGYNMVFFVLKRY